MWRKRVKQVPNGRCPYAACDNLVVITAPWFQIYQWARETISRFVPFVLIVYFNTRILCVYRRSKTQRMNVVGEHQKLNMKQKTEREEKRLWYLLLAIMTIFFVCTLPAAPLTILVTDRWDHNLPFQIIRSVSNILEFTKFALNFYLYCMINPDIRRLFLRRFTFCRRGIYKNSFSSNYPSGVHSRPAMLKGARNTLSALLLTEEPDRKISNNKTNMLSSCQCRRKQLLNNEISCDNYSSFVDDEETLNVDSRKRGKKCRLCKKYKLSKPYYSVNTESKLFLSRFDQVEDNCNDDDNVINMSEIIWEKSENSFNSSRTVRL